MNRRSLSTISLAAALALPLLAASVQAASAAPLHVAGKGSQARVATGHAAPSSKMPVLPHAALKGYQQIFSDLLTDPAGAQTGGFVSCPTGTRLVGGGAIISGTSLSENLNSSVPSADGLSWLVWVNNSTTTAGSFRVYANCVTKVKKYAVVFGAGVANPAGTQTTATVTCPTGTVPLGGGGFASSSSLAVNLNSSIPTSNGWRADMNDNTTSSNTATAYAICGKAPTSYTQISGTPSTVNAFSQGTALVTCPVGTLVLGGGGFSNSGSTAVDLNSSAPAGSNSWRVYENDGMTSPSSLTAYAVCGKAS